MGNNKVGQLILKFGSRSIGHPLADLLVYSPHNVRVSVTKNERPPRAAEIEIAVAVDVKKIGTLTLFYESRYAADRFESSHWRVYPAGNNRLRQLK
jgi:hypothetical protein